MTNIHLKKEEQNKFAVITAIYKGERYSSIPLELIQDSDNMKLILTLAETGTDTTNMIKFPISESMFMIFSRTQLNETLFEIEILDSPNDKKKIKQINNIKLC